MQSARRPRVRLRFATIGPGPGGADSGERTGFAARRRKNHRKPSSSPPSARRRRRRRYDDACWRCYLHKQWVARPDVSLRFHAASPRPTAGVADAVAVECRYGNLAGGYRRTERTQNGAPVYHNEESDKDLWKGPEDAWVFTDAPAGVDADGDYAS